MAVQEKRRVRDGYDDLGGDIYNLVYREEQEVKYDVVFTLVDVGLDGLVLDDGCGSGMLLDRLNCSVVGFDISGNLLATAKQKLKPLHYLVLGDAERLPFREGVFENVISVTVLQNTPTPENTVEEIRRVSRYGGTAAVTVLKRAMTAERFRGLFEKSGFRSVTLLPSEDSHDWFIAAKR